MGKFIFGTTLKIDIDDRVLAHLQTVILSKVRRGEAFSFTWKDDLSTGGGRTTVYIHAHSAMAFKYQGSRHPTLNPAWLHDLSHHAQSRRGLYVCPEPDREAVNEVTQSPMQFRVAEFSR